MSYKKRFELLEVEIDLETKQEIQALCENL